MKKFVKFLQERHALLNVGGTSVILLGLVLMLFVSSTEAGVNLMILGEILLGLGMFGEMLIRRKAANEQSDSKEDSCEPTGSIE